MLSRAPAFQNRAHVLRFLSIRWAIPDCAWFSIIREVDFGFCMVRISAQILCRHFVRYLQWFVIIVQLVHHSDGFSSVSMIFNFRQAQSTIYAFGYNAQVSLVLVWFIMNLLWRPHVLFFKIAIVLLVVSSLFSSSTNMWFDLTSCFSHFSKSLLT